MTLVPPLRLTTECQGHWHRRCNHVISATMAAVPMRVFCECPCHEAMLLRVQNAFMRESIKNLKAAQQ